jgi:hypothetical protein
LFLPCICFFAIIAGIGFEFVCKQILKKFLKPILLLIILIPNLINLIMVHPYELSYYNIFVRGISGAQKIGFESTYWGDAINREVLSYLNHTLPHNANIKFIPFNPNEKCHHISILNAIPFVIDYYHQKKFLREDIQIYGLPPYDYLVLHLRQGFFDNFCWRLYKNAIPIKTFSLNGVPLVLIYRLEGK